MLVFAPAVALPFIMRSIFKLLVVSCCPCFWEAGGESSDVKVLFVVGSTCEALRRAVLYGARYVALCTRSPGPRRVLR
jgi:hypothetical protein